jgi:hypothetical protein
MLGLDRGELLLGLLAPLGGALQPTSAVGWRLVQLGLEPVTLGTQLGGGGGANVQP